MIAKREEDRFAFDARRRLNDVRVMPNDEVRAVLHQPARLLLLGVSRPIQQFVAPVNGYNNEVRQLASEPQLLRQLD